MDGRVRRTTKGGAAYITARLQATCSRPAAGSARPDRATARAIGSPGSGRRTLAGESGRDVPVLFLEQSEAGIDVAVGDLEQARRAAGAAVDDAVALRQRENVALVPANRLVADLAFAGALHHAANRVRGGAEGKRARAVVELNEEAVDHRHAAAAGERVDVAHAPRAVARGRRRRDRGRCRGIGIAEHRR